MKVSALNISSIAQWFQRAVPAPTDKNRAVQVGCHIEEVSEMWDALGYKDMGANISEWGNYFKKELPALEHAVDRTELLDSLCDQIVTAIGVAHMFGMDIRGALAEVDRSNWSKFVDGVPVFDANGKIAKPASYSKPDLAAFVGPA